MKIQALVITTLAIASLNAQEAPTDPYVKGNKVAAEPPADHFNISICYEDFSLPLAQAAALQREHLTDAQLYAKILAAAGKDSVRQETFSVVRCTSGHMTSVENITEIIYPTAYEPDNLSVAVTTRLTGTIEDGKDVPAAPLPVPGPIVIARVPALPAAFETRNTGFTMEIQPTLAGNRDSVDLRIVPGRVTLVGKSTAGQGFSTTEMPIFESQRVSTSAIVKINEPYLLGTMSQPPVSRQDPDSANRVWFAFVTATLSK